MDNFITGEIYTNYLETTTIESHEGSFEGTIVTDQLEGVLETSVLSSTTHTITSYALNENSYVRAIVAQGEDHSQDSAAIYEINRYSSINAYEDQITSPMIQNAGLALLDPEEIFPTNLGFTLEETTIEAEEEGFRITFRATAEEGNGYGDEDDDFSILLDYLTGDIKEIRQTTRVYDIGHTSDDFEESAGTYQLTILEIHETGTRTEGEVTKVDLSTFEASQVQSNIYSVQEVEEGEIAPEKVQAILANIRAYTIGTNRDDFTIETTEIIDPMTYESLGSGTGVGTAVLYEDDLYSESIEYTLEDGSTIIQARSNEAKDDGIHQSVMPEYPIPGQYVTIFADYFTPGPFTATGGTGLNIYICNETASAGFVDSGRELLEATKEGNTITIAFTVDTDIPGFMSTHLEARIVIVDDFVTHTESHYTQTSDFMGNSETNETHDLTKGDPLPRA